MDKEKKYFHCLDCRYVWETVEYTQAGEHVFDECPICSGTNKVVETTYRVLNLQKGWDKSTGPVTEEGKTRIALNAYKHGKNTSKYHVMAPAKPGKFPICDDCTLIDDCKKYKYKYCPTDLETVAMFIQAYKEGKVNDLRELAGLAQAQTHKIFTNMIHHILAHGVMFKTRKYQTDKDGQLIKDDDGNPVFSEYWEKNQLLKEIPGFIKEMGFSAELQDMTPKTRQESEVLKGYIDDKEANQVDLVRVKRDNLEEMKRMREAVEKLSAGKKLKAFNDERDNVDEQTTDTPSESS